MNPYGPAETNRKGLKRVEVPLDAEDMRLLDELVEASGLRQRTRFIRWLLWVWKDLQAVETGKHPELKVAEGKQALGPLVDDPQVPIRLGYLNAGKFRGVVLKKLPDGWRKG